NHKKTIHNSTKKKMINHIRTQNKRNLTSICYAATLNPTIITQNNNNTLKIKKKKKNWFFSVSNSKKI
ncbi:hypothetical protein M569_06175, partial [Genlisea aurea]